MTDDVFEDALLASPPASGKSASFPASTAPVIPGFFPDPTICRAGDDYYLATSSFEYFPGAPVFHSRDLVTWEQVGNILTRRSQFAAGDRRPSGGIFGSTLRYHNGTFWFVTTNMSEFGGGHLLLTAENPAGPWSDPVQIPGTLGIDPDLAWDADGNCYLTWVGFGPADNASGIVQARLDPQAGKLLEPPRKVWQGTGLAFPEGPHLYRVGDWWYLLLAEGGTERGHAVSVSRSTTPEGPFEPHPQNPIFSHRSTAAVAQNTGHADLVQAASGEWAAVYLGVRPRGSVPGYHVLGRETFLAGIRWDQGWPAFEEDHYQVPRVDTAFTDDFRSGELHLRWIAPGEDPASFTSLEAEGLLISGSGNGDLAPLLATRVRDEAWTASATVRPRGGATARFELRVDASHRYGVETDGRTVRAVARIGPLQQELGSAACGHVDGGASAECQVQLVIVSGAAPNAGLPGKNYGPDEVSLGFQQDGQLTVLATLDGRYLSTEVAGGFTGRVMGLSVRNGSAVLERFDYRAGEPA
ncbi:glycoside hydrolase family 43 protein [Arthrobacter sp. S39]|uniref:glycoside hydrolase family 43 protein n=1 Tax=Arthrobacter sp. S39 TaxID=2509720 RepID=UPI0010370EE7|nr:glycoside hydrolase family 43 protein [Arthrobacter sp. S39]TAP41983.1 glycoside hydrolase family 43 protein [Arthrobacter sp. S39]